MKAPDTARRLRLCRRRRSLPYQPRQEQLPIGEAEAVLLVLRASKQKDQPCDGLHNTIEHFLAHFSHDSRAQTTVEAMQRTLAQDAAKQATQAMH